MDYPLLNLSGVGCSRIHVVVTNASLAVCGEIEQDIINVDAIVPDESGEDKFVWPNSPLNLTNERVIIPNRGATSCHPDEPRRGER